MNETTIEAIVKDGVGHYRLLGGRATIPHADACLMTSAEIRQLLRTADGHTGTGIGGPGSIKDPGVLLIMAATWKKAHLWLDGVYTSVDIETMEAWAESILSNKAQRHIDKIEAAKKAADEALRVYEETDKTWQDAAKNREAAMRLMQEAKKTLDTLCGRTP